MTDGVTGTATMNEQFEGLGKEYFATPIRIPDIEVVGPRLLVKPPKMGDLRLSSGVVIPERVRDRVDRGLVLIVGNGIVPEGARWEHKSVVPNVNGDPKQLGLVEGRWVDAEGREVSSRFEPGMEVLYAKYAGAEIDLYGETYLIINEADVRCILERYRLNDGTGA